MSKAELRSYLNEGKAYFDKRADRDIQINRKGSFTLIIKDENNQPIKDALIDIKMKKIDFSFGANIFMLGEYQSDEQNRAYEKLFTDIFNLAVVPLYWEGTEPQQNNLRYDVNSKHDVYRRPPADYVVDFCKRNNLDMKGHVLLWHEFVPKWLPDNYSEIKPLIAKRFKEIGERYSSKISMFDVVNEPSRIYDVYMRDRFKGKGFFVPEDGYIEWAFNLARQHFPANKLILNDTVSAAFHEFRGKYSAYYLNIKELLSKNVSIDEIGMQCHLGDSGGENVYNAERYYNVLDTYSTLGKPINISEISIPSEFDGDIDEELQAELAVQLYKATFSHNSTTGIVWWNLPDDGVLATKRVAGDENIPSTALVDKHYKPKKAYNEIKRLIKEEWTTNTSGKTIDGMFNFEGFYGTYNLEITLNEKKVTKEIKLLKDQSKICHIII